MTVVAQMVRHRDPPSSRVAIAIAGSAVSATTTSSSPAPSVGDVGIRIRGLVVFEEHVPGPLHLLRSQCEHLLLFSGESGEGRMRVRLTRGSQPPRSHKFNVLLQGHC